jgi:6-phosphogluconolactonase (cycloisomerase 2 family)
VQVEGSPFQLQGDPSLTTRAFRIAIDPAGHYVFAVDCTTDRVFTLRIDNTSGALVQTGEATAGGHACGLALDPSGTFAFVASTGGLDGQGGGVWSFRIDPANGALTPISSVAAAAGTHPTSVAVHPTGKFAYAVSFGSDPLADTRGDVNAYRIESNGALTSIGTPVKTGGSPGSINVAPTGRYAYGVAYNTISGYRIDADTGLLTEIDGSPLTFDNGQAESMTFSGVL